VDQENGTSNGKGRRNDRDVGAGNERRERGRTVGEIKGVVLPLDLGA